MSVKKILNSFEEATHRSLKEVCEKYGAFVFPKLRVADVFAIEGSGLSNEEYRFALQSHFDFVVTDNKHSPLFSVEFDGPTHDKPEQRKRDQLKNRLCERFSFPLLRVNALFLPKKYRDMDLLGWFIEVWFYREAFFSAQKDGLVPPDEPFDPFMVMGLPSRKERFPLWLSVDARIKIQELHTHGQCYDLVPSEWIGLDENGNYHGVMWLMVTQGSGVLVRSGIRAQRFPVLERELLSELLVFQLYEELDRVLRGDATSLPASEIDKILKKYESKYRCGTFSGTARSPGKISNQSS